MATKKIYILTSEVEKEVDLEDIVRYNSMRRERINRGNCYLAVYSTINGYHHFKIKPTLGISMTCEREPENPHDNKAIKVILPTQASPCVVGRMPKNVCQVVSNFMDGKEILHTTVFRLDKMHHGPSEDFGQGPKLVAVYFFEFLDPLKRNALAVQLKKCCHTLKEFCVP